MNIDQQHYKSEDSSDSWPPESWSSEIDGFPSKLSTLHAAEAPLQRIAAKGVAPIILVVGSRKDYLSLSESIQESSDSANYSVIPSARSISPAARHSTLFAIRSATEGFVGITSQDLAECCRATDRRTTLFHVGSETNVAYAAEALRSAVPHFPLAVLRIGEDLKRTAGASMSAFPAVCEHLSSTAVPTDSVELLSRIVSRCLDVASISAGKLLAPVEITNSGDPIPPSVYSCMENVLIPQATEANLHILLRGGCGIVAFMPHPRPISLDIDFTALLKVQEFDRFKKLMQQICQGGDFEVRGCPLAGNSKRSTYLKGKVILSQHDNTEVSLDAVSVRRVGGELFSFEFKYDKVVNRYHRIASLDSGATIGIVAPELNLVEKLVAGRGKELDKFDILDSTGILANQELELTLIQRLIERQRYDQKLDAKIDVELLKASTLDRQLVDLGVLSDIELRLRLLRALHNNTLFSDRHNELRAKGVVYHILNHDTLKKVALINKLLKGLEEVERVRNDVDNRLKPPSSAVELWGEGAIMEAVSKLRAFLYSYVEYQLLRKDVYVQRNSRSFERSESDGFWTLED